MDPDLEKQGQSLHLKNEKTSVEYFDPGPFSTRVCHLLVRITEF